MAVLLPVSTRLAASHVPESWIVCWPGEVGHVGLQRLARGQAQDNELLRGLCPGPLSNLRGWLCFELACALSSAFNQCVGLLLSSIPQKLMGLSWWHEAHGHGRKELLAIFETVRHLSLKKMVQLFQHFRKESLSKFCGIFVKC
jgi:hypothetical protein